MMTTLDVIVSHQCAVVRLVHRRLLEDALELRVAVLDQGIWTYRF